MTYQIRSTPMFDRQFKALYKKYPSLKNDVARLFAEIQNNPKIGTLLFDDVYKVRMSITSKNKGKSGGARVIYFNMFAKKPTTTVSSHCQYTTKASTNQSPTNRFSML